jgi:DNA-binding MurR/RpiR family transcriptional regulator
VDVPALISAGLPELSPNDRRIASWLLDHYAEASFETAESLAGRVGVSKAAVVRFGTRLGFGGFAGLHEAIAQDALEQLARHDTQPAPRGRVLDRWAQSVTAAVERTRAALDDAVLADVAALLDDAGGRTYLFGERRSAALAEYAYFLLNPLVANVQPVQLGTTMLADALLDVDSEDRLVAFAFRRHARVTEEVVDSFAQVGASIVVVTDEAAGAPAALAGHVLLCDSRSPGPFASAAGGLFAVEALAAAVADRLGERGDLRRDEAEELWGRFLA